MISTRTRQLLKERSRGICEAKITDDCLVKATDIHHKKMRSRGGSNNLINLAHLCRRCHSEITLMKKGTEKWRTHRWQPEGVGEND